MGKGSYLGPVIPFPSFHLDSTFFDGMFKNLESAMEILGKLDVKRLSSTRRQGMAGVRGKAKEAAGAPLPAELPQPPQQAPTNARRAPIRAELLLLRASHESPGDHMSQLCWPCAHLARRGKVSPFPR